MLEVGLNELMNLGDMAHLFALVATIVSYRIASLWSERCCF